MTAPDPNAGLDTGADVAEFAREVYAMLAEIGERAATIAPRIGPMAKDDAAVLDEVWRAAIYADRLGERLVTRLVDAYRQGTATARRRNAAHDLFRAVIDGADDETLAALESALQALQTTKNPEETP